MSSFIKFLGEKLLSDHGKTQVDTTSLDSVPVVALYFSANWCPPCKQFTPKLKQMYQTINASNKKLEIVWVSADEEEEEFDEYYETMPWLSIPFDQEDLRGECSEHFGIEGIPRLLILNKDGTVKNGNGINEVKDNGAEAFNSWQ